MGRTYYNLSLPTGEYKKIDKRGNITIVWYRNRIRRVIIESRLFKDVQEGLLSDLAEKSVFCYHMEVMAMDTVIVM